MEESIKIGNKYIKRGLALLVSSEIKIQILWDIIIGKLQWLTSYNNWKYQVLVKMQRNRNSHKVLVEM